MLMPWGKHAAQGTLFGGAPASGCPAATCAWRLFWFGDDALVGDPGRRRAVGAELGLRADVVAAGGMVSAVLRCDHVGARSA
jgi:hypothetical protein